MSDTLLHGDLGLHNGRQCADTSHASQLGLNLDRQGQQRRQRVQPARRHSTASQPAVDRAPVQAQALSKDVPPTPLIGEVALQEVTQGFGGGDHDVRISETVATCLQNGDKFLGYVSEMSVQRRVADKLCELRAHAGLTVREAAKLVKMSAPGLNAWELGDRGASLDTLAQLFESYGGRAVILFGGPEDAEVLAAAERVGRMTRAEAEPLLRWLKIWDDMPAMERGMVARMAEVRAEMLSAVAERSLDEPQPLPAHPARQR